ncbi:hypothetical protein ACP8HI_08735 [Paenibacillus sp. FA6]|uniref:hypothetical protein n=1 Tax=Paenibacillus sp. FA6 TaxID=3413029 RepID=UPI003F65BB31
MWIDVFSLFEEVESGAKWQSHPVKIDRFACSIRQLKPFGRKKYATLDETAKEENP